MRVTGARLADGAPVVFLHAGLAQSQVLEPSTFVTGPGFAIGADVRVIAGPGCSGIDLRVDGVTQSVVIRADEDRGASG